MSNLALPLAMFVACCFDIPIAIPYLIASCLFISAVFLMSLICLSVHLDFGPVRLRGDNGPFLDPSPYSRTFA